MTFKSNRFILFFFIVGYVSCSGHQSNPKQETDKLWERELKNQNNAKYGNKHPDITVITDALQVATFRKELLLKIQQQKEAEVLKQTEEDNIATHYKKGDKTVVHTIMAVLKSNDVEKKNELLGQLQKEYDDTFSITEPAIIKQILNAVDDDATEKAAVQLAGFNALPGYETTFENRLLSGKSTDRGRILYWLSKEAKNKKGLTYISQLINNNQVQGEELDEVINALENYGSKGDAATKASVGSIALIIYQKKLISRERFDDLKNSAMTSASPEGLLNCLFNYGDERVIPIAHDILNRKIRTVGPIKALIRLEGPKLLSEVYKYLDNEKYFYTGLDLVEELDKKYVDDKLLKDVLVQFAKRKDIEKTDVDRIVRSFIDLRAENYLKQIATIIPDHSLSSRIKHCYALKCISADDVIKDLIDAGLITERPDTKVINETTKDADHDPVSMMNGILESKKRYLTFDAETDFVPVDYDKLLNEFAEKSDGILKDMLVGMDVDGGEDHKGLPYVVEGDNDPRNTHYTITVVLKNCALIAKPKDMGDWYDIMSINALLDKILEHSGTEKRFVPVETGDQTVQYIFGVPAKVNELIKKYQ